MESANLYSETKVEEQYVKYTSLITQTGHQVSTVDEWKPELFPYNRNPIEAIPRSRDLWPAPLVRTSMHEDSFNQQSANEFFASDSFPKLSDMMYCNSSTELLSKKHYVQSSDQDLGGNLWHNNFSISNNMTDQRQFSSEDLYSNAHAQAHSPCLETAAADRYDFNHILPSTNFATSDLCSTLFSTSLDLNLKSLDLLTSTYDGGSCNQSFVENIGKAGRNALTGHGLRRESNDNPSTSSKASAFVSGSITSTKRPASFSETKESHTKDAKKHRSSMSRSPCPTLKVRKEKLGDRVSALQKLVAPFGKTDTASVLTEAIGYIQFLHNQVETLSVPFMKSSSRSKFYRTKQTGPNVEEQKKPDLRSRGLCLVPQSCAEYFINRCFNGI